MNNPRHEIALMGCAPTPMAAYLKALGVLRLITEQVDSTATGCWIDDTFHIQSKLNQEELIRFFKEEYQPTPLVGPWGARSGFYPDSSESSARSALTNIESSKDKRFQLFREAIQITRRILDELGIQIKSEVEPLKQDLMRACRASFPDYLLSWLDATYVLLNEDTKFPPLLGTGGNEGSGSYMSGFSQQVVSVLVERSWDHALKPSLLGAIEAGVGTKQTPGHFSPEAAGGVNAAQEFEGSLTTNPWDYLLTLEGTLIFAAASSKRLKSSTGGELSYPFCVRSSGVGYGSADFSDESSARAEIWLPIWRNPSTVSEIASLFSEGRVEVKGAAGKTGVDFARAIATYGVDRGISEFARYGFHLRNGKSYFAVPLGRYFVKSQSSASLLNKIHPWLERFRRAASSKNAPSSAGRALRQLESAILELCQRKGPERVQGVVVALGEAETVLARSPSFRQNNNISLPPLVLPPEWLPTMDDGSPEFRLAAVLAGIGDKRIGTFREHLEPVEVDIKGSRVWWLEETSPKVVWGLGGLLRNLAAVLSRRVVEAVQQGPSDGQGVVLFPGESSIKASLGDIHAFLEGKVDLNRLESLLKGMALLDWPRIRKQGKIPKLKGGPSEPMPSAVYAFLKLTHLSSPFVPKNGLEGIPIRLSPSISRLAASNRLFDATNEAVRRLRSSGLPPRVETSILPAEDVERLVASLLFCISPETARKLAKRVLDLAQFEHDETPTEIAET